jgi:CheY-like chemotaxis protein
VEDDPADVELIRIAVEDCAVVIEVLRDGASAVSFASAGEFRDGALFLIDLNLPLCDGFEVLEALRTSRANGRHVEAIAMSSSVRASDRERALALGASDFFLKPGSVDDLTVLAAKLQRRLEQVRQLTCQD